MNASNKRRGSDREFDMMPMADVTFLLLIFFMITASFGLQKSIEMPRQRTNAPGPHAALDPQPKETVEVQIDKRGSFFVRASHWELETPGKQALITALKRANETAQPTRLAIKVHERCKLQFLVDAIDAGTIAKYGETQITQVERF